MTKKQLMKSKSADIYFFTGTGNTYLAAKKMAEVFEQNAIPTRLIGINIDKNNFLEIDHTKTIGIAFPIACWNTYPFVRRFIQNMPQAFGTEIFVFSTMGDSSLKTAANFGSILKDKGYSVIGTKGFKMPNNWILVQNDEKNNLKKEKAFRKISTFAAELINGTAKPESTNIFLKLCFAFTSFITNLIESSFSQKLIGLKAVEEKCTKCGLCVSICPVKNISMKAYPVFDGNKCQLCLRCISYCPEKAIVSRVVGKKHYKALNDTEQKQCFL
ncbi:MAG: EFR1 family ferrodoxin [Endomicrobia bacterium]|nr:EFR1 family ferrodoxin [Endomicrobiia bacterium]MCL2506204.1 EFR1 family ferrodoxin [Endomicrobiia bacterium]